MRVSTTRAGLNHLSHCFCRRLWLIWRFRAVLSTTDCWTFWFNPIFRSRILASCFWIHVAASAALSAKLIWKSEKMREDTTSFDEYENGNRRRRGSFTRWKFNRGRGWISCLSTKYSTEHQKSFCQLSAFKVKSLFETLKSLKFFRWKKT